MHRITALLAVCIYILPLNAYSERYSVEEDSFGGYTAKKIETSPASNALTVPNPAPSEDQFSAQEQEHTEVVTSPPDQKKSSVKSENSNSYIGNVGDKLSPFEKAYIETEKLERKKALDALKNAPISGEAKNLTDVNPSDYVDGDDLLKKGSRAASEGSSYYTMVDADGSVRNVEYDRDAVQEALDIQSSKKIEFTETDILLKSKSSLELPESADPFAAQLLAGNNTSNSYFEAFSVSCCESLPEPESTEMELGKSHYFELNGDQLPYRFSDGDSRFILLALPKSRHKQALKLRSFIRRHKSHGIENGVFFPQLVTLDEAKKPLRIFTGPLLKYHSETWLAHGYLEGFFQLDPTKKGKERYLLVNTTRDILKQESNIEDEDGLTIIQHMEIGTIELELLDEI